VVNVDFIVDRRNKAHAQQKMLEQDVQLGVFRYVRARGIAQRQLYRNSSDGGADYC
jgi:hypothetical protein